MEICLKESHGQVFGIFEDIDLMIHLRKDLRIVAKAVGTLSFSLQNKVLGPPFILNSYQLKYLIELGLLPGQIEVNEEKFKIFKYFTDQMFRVKSGTKFGCDFLAYPGDPLYCHATKMILVCRELNALTLVQLGRISHDTNKELLIAYIENDVVKTKKVSWVNTGARYSLYSERKVARRD